MSTPFDGTGFNRQEHHPTGSAIVFTFGLIHMNHSVIQPCRCLWSRWRHVLGIIDSGPNLELVLGSVYLVRGVFCSETPGKEMAEIAQMCGIQAISVCVFVPCGASSLLGLRVVSLLPESVAMCGKQLKQAEALVRACAASTLRALVEGAGGVGSSVHGEVLKAAVKAAADRREMLQYVFESLAGPVKPHSGGGRGDAVEQGRITGGRDSVNLIFSLQLDVSPSCPGRSVAPSRHERSHGTCWRP